MKTLSILLLFLLFGCAAPSTLELIERARFTGDWSLVDKRIDTEQTRTAERGPLCPKGTTRWCEVNVEDESCSCVRNADVRQVIDTVRL